MRSVVYAALVLTLVASLGLGGCGPSTWLRTSPGIEEVREAAASPPPVEMALPEPRLQVNVIGLLLHDGEPLRTPSQYAALTNSLKGDKL